MLNWSDGQRAALEVIARWKRSGSGQVLRVFGYAGTGKTTLIKYLVEGCHHYPVKVPWGEDEYWSIRVATFTGKAAQVLRIKGVQQASTIHRMIYRSREQSEAELLLVEKKLKEGVGDRDERRGLELRRQQLIAELNRPIFDLNPAAFDHVGAPDYIIIDECSMLQDELSEDLLSFGIPVMVFGDPAQLPPVEGGNVGYFMRDKPDVMLTEIHRQARDNPIIQMATAVRSGEGLILPHGEYGESSIVRNILRWWETHDQLLVGTNMSRDIRNREARRGLGFSGKYPMVGERLVCLKNNHDQKLLNGSLWQVEDVAGGDDEGETRLGIDLSLSSLDIPGLNVVCSAWKEIFSLGQKAFTEKYPTWGRRSGLNEFDFGYALTVHKAQGSEWDRVVILDESRYWRKNATHRNWLYTGITRAAKKLTLVRPEKFWRC